MMSRKVLLAPILGLSAITAACQTAGYSTAGVAAPCMTTQAMRATVVAIEMDSVVAEGPDGLFNVAKSYLQEMPRVGDVLVIKPTDVNGNCVYTPAY
ncbi:MAG: hypothetical protein CMK07_16865 [Ponticaulis sp.]|nr:hypothetical protein [Ponticaulis sp.]